MLEYRVKLKLQGRDTAMISEELPPGMLIKLFPAGHKRIFYVMQEAVEANLRDKKDYPTFAVVDNDGSIYHFHAVTTFALFKFDPKNKIQFVTTEKIMGFVNPFSQRTFPDVVRQSFWKKLMIWMFSRKRKPSSILERASDEAFDD